MKTKTKAWDENEDATGDDSNGKIKTGLWLQYSRSERGC